MHTADLVTLDPTVRLLLGQVHAALDGNEVVQTTPSLCIWTTDGRIAPTIIHEASLQASVQEAHALITGKLNARRRQRERDEAEGGVIIPDYMY